MGIEFIALSNGRFGRVFAYTFAPLEERPVPLDEFRRSAPGFSVSAKTAVIRRRPMFAFVFRFAVVLASAVIVLLVTTWRGPASRPAHV